MNRAPEHLRVQHAIVKLLYDPRFDVAQAGLSATRRAQLSQIDRRALDERAPRTRCPAQFGADDAPSGAFVGHTTN